MQDCYYDNELAQNNEPEGYVLAEPRSSPAMTYPPDSDTYETWDFEEVWRHDTDYTINDGYPFFIWMGGEPTTVDDEYIPSYPPHSVIQLYFRSGDSERYPMGIYYVDRSQAEAGGETVKLDARNTIGKFLRDQQFDEKTTYQGDLSEVFETILYNAGLNRYAIDASEVNMNMEFGPATNYYDGIQELLKSKPGWQIRESLEGRVLIGDRNSPMFGNPGTYTFLRDRDLFSRSITRDDGHVYARVCVHYPDFSERVYQGIESELDWQSPAQKVYYAEVPEGTPGDEMQSYAQELAELHKNSGEIETFVGPFRPHLQPGDIAKIADVGGERTVGIITDIQHTFGKGGFITTISIDRGGSAGRVRLTDYITEVTTRLQRKAAERTQ